MQCGQRWPSECARLLQIYVKGMLIEGSCLEQEDNSNKRSRVQDTNIYQPFLVIAYQSYDRTQVVFAVNRFKARACNSRCQASQALIPVLLLHTHPHWSHCVRCIAYMHDIVCLRTSHVHTTEGCLPVCWHAALIRQCSGSTSRSVQGQVMRCDQSRRSVPRSVLSPTAG